MSELEELVLYVRSLAGDAESKGYELLQLAERLGHFISSFNALVQGTNDPSAKLVCASFTAAQKDLYKAAKASLEAAKAGYEWDGGTTKNLVLKKVRR